MSAPPLDPPSHSTSGHQDGLGRRTLSFDREGGLILERLHVRPELGAFEAALRERLAIAARFEDERFARVRSIERDPSGGLAVVSEFVAGNRVCDLLDAASGLAAEDATSLSVDAALGFLLEILPALAALHTAAGFAHGAVGPDRTVLTPTGQVVLLDSVFGHTLERLQFNRRRLWHELRIAAPAAAGPARFDVASDLGQAALTALMIVIGRPLKDTEYPDGLAALVTEVVEIAQIRGSARFASGLHRFLQRTLPLPGRKPYATADEAATELRQLAREIGVQRCGTALIAFIDDMNRNLATIETAAGAAEHPAPDAAIGFDSSAEDDEEQEQEIEAGEPEPFEELIVLSAPDDEPDVFDLEVTPQDAFVIESEAPAVELVASEEVVALEEVAAFEEAAAEEEEAAPAHTYEYQTIEVFAAPEPEAPAILVEAEAAPDFTIEAEAEQEPILAIDPEPVREPLYAVEPEPVQEPTYAIDPEPVQQPILAIEAEAVAVLAAELESRTDTEIQLVRERFALEAKQVPEPTIGFDESFPDPRIPLPATGPVLALQQETAAWRAAFVALDDANEPAPGPVPVAADPVPEPEPPTAISARKRKHGSKAERDKLRSNAPMRPVPVVVPQPVVQMPVTMAPAIQMPTPLYVPAAVSAYGRSPESTYGRTTEVARAEPSIQVRQVPIPIPVPVAPVAAPDIGLRIKTELPIGYRPMPTRADRYSLEPRPVATLPSAHRGDSESASSFPWKLVAGAVILVLVGVGAGVAYWPARSGTPAAVATPEETKAVPAAAAAANTTGAIIISTPVGARVLLDGRAAGDAPLTIQGVAAGRHTLTFVTPEGSVKKTVRVEAGKTLSLADVSVFSGVVVVFAPITLDISENGRSIGSTDVGRLILSPGRHDLTFSSREFGYSATQAVEIEPGEERSITVQPMGELSLQADPWAEVWIDGKRAGDTPMAKHPVPLGTHEVVFKNPQFGERRQTIVVTATAPGTIIVNFKP